MSLQSLKLRKCNPWIWLVSLTTLTGGIGTLPAIAHKVELSGTVGGTLHIEPNDTAIAGEAHLTWFAITRPGGETIPLADCNCQLSVYQQPYQAGNSPIQTPPLKAIAAEGYENIPGADITFPQVGAYELVLRGEPKTSGAFEPFELRFPVTVAAGQTTSPSPTPSSTAESPVTQSPTTTENQSTDRTSFLTGLAIAVGVFGVGAIATVFTLKKRSN